MLPLILVLYVVHVKSHMQYRAQVSHTTLPNCPSPHPLLHSPPLYCRPSPGTCLIPLYIPTSPIHHVRSGMPLDSVPSHSNPLPPPISLFLHLGLLYCPYISHPHVHT